MQLINRSILVKSLHDEIRIVAMGCIHHGHAACNETAAAFWYRYILQHSNTYLILGGDLVDSIFEKDKRYDEGEVAPWCRDKRWGGTLMDRQFNYALEKWLPLARAGKILWIHEGNHEQEIRLRASRDMTREWSYRLSRAARKAGHSEGVPYAGYSALSNLMVRGETLARKHHPEHGYRVTFFTTHGSGAARTAGSKMNKVLSMLHENDVDVALMWHLHDRMAKDFRSDGISEPRKDTPPVLRHRDRLAAMCGTFLDRVPGITNYGERKGHGPVTPGPMVVHMRRDYAPSQNQRKAGTAVAPTVRLWYSGAVAHREEDER